MLHSEMTKTDLVLLMGLFGVSAVASGVVAVVKAPVQLVKKIGSIFKRKVPQQPERQT